MNPFSFISPGGRAILLYGLGSLCLCLLIARCYISETGLEIETKILQYAFELRGPREPPPQVLLIAIDPKGYDDLRLDEDQFLSIGTLAQLLESIAKGKPAAIIIDFSIRDSFSKAAERIKHMLRTSPTTLPDGSRSPTDADVFQERMSYNFDNSQIYNSARLHVPMTIATVQNTMTYISLQEPRILSQPLYERVPLSRPLHDFAGIDVVPPGEQDLINFYGPPGTVTTISFSRLLYAPTPLLEYTLHDKILLLGMMGVQCGRSDMDFHHISGSTQKMYGVEVHATIAGNLIDHSWIRRVPTEKAMMIMNLTSYVLILIGVTLSLRFSAPLLALILIGVTTSYFILFAHYQVYVSGLPIVWIAGLGILPCRVLSKRVFGCTNEHIRKYMNERTTT